MADVLCRDHGFVRYEFARPLKAMLAAIGVDANDRATKELPHPVLGVSPRRMAQTLGTEWGQQCVDPDIWLMLAAQFVDRVRQVNSPESYARYVAGESGFIPPQAKGIVITDCRFQNEAAFIAGRNGDIWHIDRPGVAPVAAHSSEDGLERLPGDLVIPNRGTLDDLAVLVANAVSKPYRFQVPWSGL